MMNDEGMSMKGGGGFRGWLTWWGAALSRPLDALPLRCFECGFAVVFLLRLAYNEPVVEWLTGEGFHLTAEECGKLGYPPPFPTLPLWGAYLYLAASCGAVALLIASVRWRRVALVALFASALYAQGVDYVTAASANKQYIAVFALLMTGPGMRWDATAARWRIPAAMVHALQGTLLVIYFTSGCAKAFQGDWLKFSDVLVTQVEGFHRTDLAAWALRVLPDWAWTMQQWLALVFELGAPLLLGWRRLRPVGMVMGLGMHLVILLTMAGLWVFSLQMAMYYLLFVSGDGLRRGMKWLRLGVGEQTGVSVSRVGGLARHPERFASVAVAMVGVGLAIQAVRSVGESAAEWRMRSAGEVNSSAVVTAVEERVGDGVRQRSQPTLSGPPRLPSDALVLPARPGTQGAVPKVVPVKPRAPSISRPRIPVQKAPEGTKRPEVKPFRRPNPTGGPKGIQRPDRSTEVERPETESKAKPGEGAASAKVGVGRSASSTLR